jgi:hypothetical protein
MDITLHTTNLQQFRYTLYQNFNNRADSLLDLLDAICSKPDAQSVVEYIFKALAELHLAALWLPQRLAPYLPRPTQRPFWLLITDVTPCPRPFAHTLENRGLVYQPEVVKGKLPITIGHQYSTVVLGLEPESGVSSSWVLPLLTARVATTDDKEMVGAKQIEQLLQAPALPFGRELTVEVVDSSYSKPRYLHAHRQFPHLVTIARVRGTRTFYQPPAPSATETVPPGTGHPRWYGERFALADATTLSLQETTRQGKPVRIEIQAWHNLLMPGKNKPKLPMHQHPFTLVRIVRYDQAGKALFKHPLWLIVMGARRHELTLAHIYQAYTARFDIEHFFRFGKQKLLLADFQTPDVQREEKWWQVVHIAYAQLWMARHVAAVLPNPWERNLPHIKKRLCSPTLVQRDFARIIRQLGTPARPPQPRGNSPGRRQGTTLPPRPRCKVIIKGKIAAPTV